MKWQILGVLFLIACSQAQEPAFAPTSNVVVCQPTQTIGESCEQDCECLRPGDCLKGICSLTKLEDGQPCVENKQCLSGYCTDGNKCGGPDGQNAVFDCEHKCTDRYNTDERCYTVCKR